MFSSTTSYYQLLTISLFSYPLCSVFPSGAVVPLACDPTIIPGLHFTTFLGCFHHFLDSVTFSFLIFFHFSGVYIPSNNVQRKGSFLLTLNPDISENDSVSVFILDGQFGWIQNSEFNTISFQQVEGFAPLYSNTQCYSEKRDAV